jgi:hypothetical protein
MVLLRASWILTDIELATDLAGGLGHMDWRFDRGFRLPHE